MFLNMPKKVSFAYKFHTEKCSLVVTMAAVDKELPSGGKREEREKRAKTLTIYLIATITPSNNILFPDMLPPHSLPSFSPSLPHRSLPPPPDDKSVS